MRTPAQTAVTGDPLPPVDMTPADNTAASAGSAAVTPAVTSPSVTSAPSAVTHGAATWEQEEYSRRLSAVLSGREYTPVSQRLSAYWHEASRRFQGNNRQVVSGTVQGIRKHGPEVTVIQYAYEENDVYNSRPIVAELGPVRKAAAIADESTAETSQRLTRDMSTISPTLSYALRGIDETQLPTEYFDRMDNGNYVARQSAPTVLQWAPTNLWHHPLYFEDAPLERYGHTYHPLVQPFASTGRFAVQLAGLPYQMALHPPQSKSYSLGYYRPGEYAPKLHYQIPFNTEAALVQAAAVTGFLFIFP